ncbi:MAG: DUF4956 domain-containing protein [Clostridia bacterium]|nr:DUF4956 domain-containing protein [Clostridia bacterium]
MLNKLFKGIFDHEGVLVIDIKDFLLCMGCALLVGLLIAMAYMFKTRYSRGFVITLALLPAVVCVVIMAVNQNIGIGVAVAGAFSLVRFRSVPGTAKEIGILFLAMAAGLIIGIGYLGYAVLFTVIMTLAYILYSLINFGSRKKDSLYKTLTVTIPEDINYVEVFDEIMSKYTSASELVRVKTTNMGSLFKLTYNVTLKNAGIEKEFIDAIRCRNSNLEISVSRQENVNNEL